MSPNALDEVTNVSRSNQTKKITDRGSDTQRSYLENDCLELEQCLTHINITAIKKWIRRKEKNSEEFIPIAH